MRFVNVLTQDLDKSPIREIGSQNVHITSKIGRCFDSRAAAMPAKIKARLENSTPQSSASRHEFLSEDVLCDVEMLSRN